MIRSPLASLSAYLSVALVRDYRGPTIDDSLWRRIVPPWWRRRVALLVAAFAIVLIALILLSPAAVAP